jgi:hypothetical protein
MKIEPKPSDREVLAGLVERVTYHNAENGFCVLRARARRTYSAGLIGSVPRLANGAREIQERQLGIN